MGDERFVYIGTYTRGKSEGIYVYRMDRSTGALRHQSTAVGVENPSFLALSPDNQYLYAVNEVKAFEETQGGAVSAFAVAKATGDLSFVNTKPTFGADPCHLVVDATGRFVLVANYTGGSLTVFPIRRVGDLGDPTDFVQHLGSSIDAQRQEGPHAHSIVLDPTNRYAFAPDLGLDKVMSYTFDAAKGRLKPNVEPWAKVTPGAGPRHFAFHPSGAYAYLITELNSTLTAFNYDAACGALREQDTVPALPAEFEGQSHCADIHVTPSGRFVYGSNRGHDSLVIYAIDRSTGALTYVGHESTRGRTPRNFAIDPTGRFLLAANQNSDTVVVFRIDPDTGQLTGTGHVADVPTPVCLLFSVARPG
jgi:6-phosphogluconolactonase